MCNLKESVDKEFEEWKNTAPNAIQRGTGVLTQPIEYLLKPFINKVAPLLEDVLKSSNNIISGALNSKNEFANILNLTEVEFEEWLKKTDLSAKNYVTGGIASLTAEGAVTGLGGFALLAVDIPASFGLIMGFSNKIALSYQLDILNEDVQVEILKAIAAGSETSVEGKASAIETLKVVSNIVNKQTWKGMGQAVSHSLPHVIVAVSAFLRKLGVNITKRKAAQLIPVIGGATGAVINGSWASDALEAVRQHARKSIVENYCTHRDNSKTVIDI